jgi:Holliday junction resolvasome RuvABC ATP-dependent DNA helicase subunit
MGHNWYACSRAHSPFDFFLPAQAKPKDMTKKAVLLSGPPGIGKTSSAHIVAK